MGWGKYTGSFEVKLLQVDLDPLFFTYLSDIHHMYAKVLIIMIVQHIWWILCFMDSVEGAATEPKIYQPAKEILRELALKPTVGKTYY
jgi:hypothetical protein